MKKHRERSSQASVKLDMEEDVIIVCEEEKSLSESKKKVFSG